MKVLSDILIRAGLYAAKEITVESFEQDSTLSSLVVYDPVSKRLKVRSTSTLQQSTGNNTTAANIGAGVGLYAQKVDDELQIKSLIAGSGIVITSGETGVTIANGGVLSVNGKTGIAVLTTADISEDGNLYFTQARARSSVSASGVLAFDQNTGVFSISQASGASGGFLSSADWTSFNSRVPSTRIINTVHSIQGGGSLTADRTLSLVGDVATPAANFYYGTNASGTRGWFALPVFEGGVSVLSVNGLSGTVVLTTADIAESTNLYFTNVRARLAISVSGSLSYDSATGVISYTTPNSDGISEGASNLYFTVARARQSVSAGTGISYNSSTGVITNSAPDQVVTLTAGANISITGTYPNFTIAATEVGEVNTASNVGSIGARVFKQKSGVDFQYRRLVAGSNVTITENADDIVIAVSGTGGGGGEVNTMSNLGVSGAGVFAQKNGVDFEMRRIVGGVNMVVTENPTNITLEANIAPQVIMLSGTLFA